MPARNSLQMARRSPSASPDSASSSSSSPVITHLKGVRLRSASQVRKFEKCDKEIEELQQILEEEERLHEERQKRKRRHIDELQKEKKRRERAKKERHPSRTPSKATRREHVKKERHSSRTPSEATRQDASRRSRSEEEQRSPTAGHRRSRSPSWRTRRQAEVMPKRRKREEKNENESIASSCRAPASPRATSCGDDDSRSSSCRTRRRGMSRAPMTPESSRSPSWRTRGVTCRVPASPEHTKGGDDDTRHDAKWHSKEERRSLTPSRNRYRSPSWRKRLKPLSPAVAPPAEKNTRHDHDDARSFVGRAPAASSRGPSIRRMPQESNQHDRASAAEIATSQQSVRHQNVFRMNTGDQNLICVAFKEEQGGPWGEVFQHSCWMLEQGTDGGLQPELNLHGPDSPLVQAYTRHPYFEKLSDNYVMVAKAGKFTAVGIGSNKEKRKRAARVAWALANCVEGNGRSQNTVINESVQQLQGVEASAARSSSPQSSAASRSCDPQTSAAAPSSCPEAKARPRLGCYKLVPEALRRACSQAAASTAKASSQKPAPARDVFGCKHRRLCVQEQSPEFQRWSKGNPATIETEEDFEFVFDPGAAPKEWSFDEEDTGLSSHLIHPEDPDDDQSWGPWKG